MADDPINPQHYNDLSPTPMVVIRAWSLSFSLGNTVKYIARAGRKDPARTIEDLRKAAWYLQEEIVALEIACGKH